MAFLCCLFFSCPTFSKDFKSLWHTLLHSNAPISDKSFYVSADGNADSELETFKKYLSGKDRQKWICRFPARYLLLQENKLTEDFDLRECKEFSDFIKRAPAEKISYVFAAESVSRPASVMGHSVLKLEGKGVEHSISFFTRIENISILQLFIQSLITGKNGLYALSPYSETKKYYQDIEGRNIWEYELDLTDFERKLIHYHLYELKNIKFKYFFHKFNCATLLRNIIAIKDKRVNDIGKLWVTPLDIVRGLEKIKLIKKRKLLYTDVWEMRKINSYFHNKNIVKALKNGDDVKEFFTDDKEGYASFRLAKAFYKKNKTNKDYELDKYENRYKDYSLNLSLDVSPETTIPDSQISIEYGVERSNTYETFSFLPLSHRLINDLSSYDNESEVKMGEVIARRTNKKVRVDQVNIFSIETYLPHDSLVGGSSGELKVGYKNYFDFNLDNRKSIFLRGGYGKTFQLRKAIDFYILGILEQNRNFIYGIKSGLIIREKFGFKTLVKYEYQNFLSKKKMEVFDIKQSCNFKNYNAVLSYSKTVIDKEYVERFGLGLSYLF